MHISIVHLIVHHLTYYMYMKFENVYNVYILANFSFQAIFIFCLNFISIQYKNKGKTKIIGDKKLTATVYMFKQVGKVRYGGTRTVRKALNAISVKSKTQILSCFVRFKNQN